MISKQRIASNEKPVRSELRHCGNQTKASEWMSSRASYCVFSASVAVLVCWRSRVRIIFTQTPSKEIAEKKTETSRAVNRRVLANCPALSRELPASCQCHHRLPSTVEKSKATHSQRRWLIAALLIELEFVTGARVLCAASCQVCQRTGQACTRWRNDRGPERAYKLCWKRIQVTRRALRQRGMLCFTTGFCLPVIAARRH